MACWNDKLIGSTKVVCPVCGCGVALKKKTNHVESCFKAQRSNVADMGLMKCPLNSFHVIPIVHLNHHLEGNCEEAQNALRRYFHRPELRSEMKDPPERFLAQYSDEVLNKHNKKLLYLLRKDFSGRDISDNKDLYPDPTTTSAPPPPQPSTSSATTGASEATPPTPPPPAGQ